MYDRREQLLNQLSKVVQSDSLELVLKVLSYAWFDSLPEAEKLANKLNWDFKEFYCIEGNLEKFQDYYWEEEIKP